MQNSLHSRSFIFESLTCFDYRKMRKNVEKNLCWYYRKYIYIFFIWQNLSRLLWSLIVNTIITMTASTMMYSVSDSLWLVIRSLKREWKTGKNQQHDAVMRKHLLKTISIKSDKKKTIFCALFVKLNFINYRKKSNLFWLKPLEFSLVNCGKFYFDPNNAVYTL